MTITNPEDETIHDDKLSIGAKRKEVEIKVQKVGMHEMCFELNGGKTPVRILFHIEYNGQKVLSKRNLRLICLVYLIGKVHIDIFSREHMSCTYRIQSEMQIFINISTLIGFAFRLKHVFVISNVIRQLFSMKKEHPH